MLSFGAILHFSIADPMVPWHMGQALGIPFQCLAAGTYPDHWSDFKVHQRGGLRVRNMGLFVFGSSRGAWVDA